MFLKIMEFDVIVMQLEIKRMREMMNYRRTVWPALAFSTLPLVLPGCIDRNSFVIIVICIWSTFYADKYLTYYKPHSIRFTESMTLKRSKFNIVSLLSQYFFSFFKIDFTRLRLSLISRPY